jgi:large subunit ribosomal protein L4
LGDKKSPMLRGGGRAFGPKPRDFSTELPRKVYDVAWRTALSYRYRRGELIIVDKLNLGEDEGGKGWIKELFARLGWGKGHRRSTIISSLEDAEEKAGIFAGLEDAEEEGRALMVDDVDVKDLLKTGRLVVEKTALDWMLRRHRSDLVRRAWTLPSRQ